MDFQSCWSSVACLEGWDRVLRLTSVIAGVIVVAGGLASYAVGKHIAFLKVPRTLTPVQMEMIITALRDKPKAEFMVTSWADSEESAYFGGQLNKVLKDAGWESGGMVRYYMDEGDPPPIGIIVTVDGLKPEWTLAAQSLVETCRASGIHEAKFATRAPMPDRSSRIIIQVGRKPNL